MPITQNKRRIKVQHVVGEGNAQFDVSRDIRIPSDDPDEQYELIRKIADVHAEIVELDYEILPNKVIVKGALHKQIYYIEEGENSVKEYTVTREDFTDFIHIEGADPDMEVMLDAQLLFINTDSATGDFPTRVIHQSAVISVEAKVIDILQLDVVTDVSGPGITVKKELFNVESVVGEAEVQHNISNTHTLPDDARKIYEMDAVCRDLDFEILRNKVIVRGTLHKQVYYVDDEDDTVQEVSYDNDFDVVLNIPGAEPDMDVYTSCKVEFSEANLAGPTSVKTNVILQVFAKVTEMMELNIVTDVKGAKVDRRRIRVEDIIGKKCHQENVNQPINVEPIVINKTKDLTAKLRNVQYEKIENKVIVKGLIHVQAYYVVCAEETADFAENELLETSADINFTTFVHFDGVTEDTMVQVDEKVEYTDVNLQGQSCETSTLIANAILEICIRAYEMREMVVVVDVAEAGAVVPPDEEECPEEGYYTYTIKAGDTLSKIAMKFQDEVPGLTWQAIARANPGINPHRLKIGQTIKIPCVAGLG